jgi:hypothetical protein
VSTPRLTSSRTWAVPKTSETRSREMRFAMGPWVGSGVSRCVGP